MSNKASRLAAKYIKMCNEFSEEEKLKKEEKEKLCGLVGIYVSSLVEKDGPIEFKKGGIFDKMNEIFDKNNNIKKEIKENADVFIKNKYII